MPRLRRGQDTMDHHPWLEQHDRMIADMDRMLRRAIRDSVREARNERRKRRELDDKITQLASAQLVTEEKMQALYHKMDTFLDGLNRRGNGHA